MCVSEGAVDSGGKRVTVDACISALEFSVTELGQTHRDAPQSYLENASNSCLTGFSECLVHWVLYLCLLHGMWSEAGALRS